jgi:F420-dependent oxidoreductase-like protein
MTITFAIGAGGPGSPEQWKRSVEFVQEAEKLGVAACWSAEAWGTDAVTPLAYLAAKTEKILLGSGIMQIWSRTPVMTAMTALSMASISGNRFILGLGTSGPQVVEGLHGQPFERPMQRMRETIEICKLAFAGERIVHKGELLELPRPGGEGKALKLSQNPNTTIPIYLATLSPKNLELTGELADGWLGTSFVPTKGKVQIDHIAAGAARAGRKLEDVVLSAGGEVNFTDDIEAVLAERKRAMAFSLGGMGSPTTNFYNNAFSRQGYAEVAAASRRLWVEGKRDEAAKVVPDEMILDTNMIGTPEMVRDRMRDFRDAGITMLRVGPAGESMKERLDTIGRATDIAAELNRE